jgi:hypothetical protein
MAPIESEHERLSRLAQSDGVLGERVENRLQIERGPTDYLEQVAGRSLPLERLLRLVEQPRVLDRDHRLVGEGLQQADLLTGEPARDAAGDGDSTDRFAVPNHGHGQQAAVPAFAHFPAELGGVRRIGLEVGDPGWLSAQHRLADRPFTRSASSEAFP